MNARRDPNQAKDTRFLYTDGLSSNQLVSVSQLQTFLSCRKKWKYGYIDNLTPRVDRAYLTIGKLCHKGMQVAMQTAWKDQQSDLCTDYRTTRRWESWMKAGVEAINEEWREYVDSVPLLDEEIPGIEQTLSDALSVFTQAYEEFEPWKYEVYTVTRGGKPSPALELHFLIPCAGVTRMHGFIDAILKDKETGMIWCVDYKFRKSLSPDEEEAFNLQNAVYTQACVKMGIPITGTMTWQHVNTPAADPAILKDGKISRSKIKTTWIHYSRFCAEHGQNPEDYREEMTEKLSDIEWCRATYEYRNAVTVRNIWTECIVPNVFEIQKARNPKAVLRRSMYPWNCKMCQFQSLCQGELRDYDTQSIIDREFTKRS